jgi:hypothetical protein
MGLSTTLLVVVVVAVTLVSAHVVVFDKEGTMEGANATITQLEGKISKLEKTIANLKVRVLRRRLFFSVASNALPRRRTSIRDPAYRNP